MELHGGFGRAILAETVAPLALTHRQTEQHGVLAARYKAGCASANHDLLSLLWIRALAFMPPFGRRRRRELPAFLAENARRLSLAVLPAQQSRLRRVHESSEEQPMAPVE